MTPLAFLIQERYRTRILELRVLEGSPAHHDLEDGSVHSKPWPTKYPSTSSKIEIRPVFEIHDFGDALTPELRE